MKCFYCDQEVDRDKGEGFFVAVEKPYVNILFHKFTCLREIELTDGIDGYLNKNKERVLRLVENSPLPKEKVKRK